jgi:hypothetical protein
MNATEAVKAGREACRALRRLDRSGGTSAATGAAQRRHWQTLNDALALLNGYGWNGLADAIMEEDAMIDRLYDARKLGQDRPELKARLRKARATLRTVSAS